MNQEEDYNDLTDVYAAPADAVLPSMDEAPAIVDAKGDASPDSPDVTLEEAGARSGEDQSEDDSDFEGTKATRNKRAEPDSAKESSSEEEEDEEEEKRRKKKSKAKRSKLQKEKKRDKKRARLEKEEQRRKKRPEALAAESSEEDGHQGNEEEQEQDHAGKKSKAGSRRNEPSEDEERPDPIKAVAKAIKDRKKAKAYTEYQPGEAEAACEEVLDKMTAAYELDVKAMRAGEPAFERLALLPTVCEKVSETQLRLKFDKSALANVLFNWLRPTTSGHLAPLNMRTKLYALIGDLQFEPDQLEGTKLSNLLNMLRNHKEETIENKKKLTSIITEWQKAIFGSGADVEAEAE